MVTWTESLSALAAIFGALTAMIALIVAVRNERKVEERFSAQMKLNKDLEDKAEARFEREFTLQNEIASASIAPEVQVFTYSTISHVEVTLRNLGSGAARVKNLRFSKNGIDSDTLIEAVRIDGMDRVRKYSQAVEFTIAPGERTCLIDQDLDTLKECFPDKSDASRRQVLRDLKDNIEGVLVTYRVFDILGEFRHPGEVSISRLP